MLSDAKIKFIVHYLDRTRREFCGIINECNRTVDQICSDLTVEFMNDPEDLDYSSISFLYDMMAYSMNELTSIYEQMKQGHLNIQTWIAGDMIRVEDENQL